MKTILSVFLLLALATGVWAQAPAAPAQTPQATPPPRHHDMMAMRQKHMQEMKDQAGKMRATLDKMKANLAAVKGAAAKQQAQLDVDLWESMVGHMEGMVKMMSEHEGMMGPGMMGPGMEHGGMMGGMGSSPAMKAGGGGGCCAGMQEGGGCCGGNKCMQEGHHGMHHDGTKTEAPPSADKNDK
jgi:hypothetical protein